MIKITTTIMALLLSTNLFASEKTTVFVQGMVCDFCAQGLIKKFNKKESINEVDINLSKGVVNLEFKEGQPMSNEEITKIIEDNGISVIKIEKSNQDLKHDKHSEEDHSMHHGH